MEDQPAPRGHRLLSHTADIALEAWAPTRAECIAEAVAALVESFADVYGVQADEDVGLAVAPIDDEDLLVRVLDETIYLVEVPGRVPVDTEVEETSEGGLSVRFGTAPAEAVTVVGAVPKGVSLHGLRFHRERGGWTCHVTVDV